MATLKKAVSAQYPLRANFEFNIAAGDVMVPVAGGAAVAFTGSAPAFDIVPLPFGAQVIGGELVVKTISNDAGTHTLSVGDSASATRYLGATTIKTAARTALVPTGYVSLGEALRITLAAGSANATAGKVQVMVEFVLADTRANENLKTT